MNRKKLLTALFLMVCFVFLPEVGRAQVNRGSITGTVRDSSGAIVPGVSVTLTDIDRGLKYSATSTIAGNFNFAAIAVGTYRVEAGKPGFKRFIQEPVTVYTGSSTTVNITLQVGEVNQQVTVSGSASLLDTTDAQVGGLMTTKMYQDLPLSMSTSAVYGSGRRQPEQFILTEPGVNTAVEGDILGKEFNGGQYYSGILLIDGVGTLLSLQGGQFEFASPPYESLQEFKVQTSNLPAEYGGGTGVENLTLKSGTNSYHGDLYEFLRNDAFDARGFLPAPTKAPFRENEFGGTFGGPVDIPKVYNGHNRTFFFVNVEGFKKAGAPPSAPINTVPTAAEHSGDFSALLLPQNGGIQIYDPATTRLDPATGSYVRDPFPGNIIPSNRIVPQAKYLEQYVALPNLPGQFNNFLNSEATSLTDWVWSAKVDHSFSDRNRISWSYWEDHTTSTSAGQGGDTYFLLPSASIALDHGGGHRVHDYFNISPDIENDAYAGWTHYFNSRPCAPGNNVGNNPAGIPNLQYYNPDNTGQFRWTGTGVTYFRAGAALEGCAEFGSGKFRGQFGNIFEIGDILDYFHGKHNLTFGADASKEYNTDREIAGGWYQFSGLETALPGVTTGDEWASFLLGDADADSTAGPNLSLQYQNPRAAFFAQDDWKMTRKLTMSYGLRYDYPGVTTEVHDRLAGFDPLVSNPGAGGIPGAEVFLGTGSGKTGTSLFAGVHPDWTEFSPRIGFAYALNDKTVIRTGYALIYTYGNGDAIGFDEGGAPWQQGYRYGVNLVSPDNGVTPATTLQGGLPVPSCSLPCTNPALVNGGVPLYWDPNSGKQPYIQQWTFSIQRYLPGNLFVSAAYVGNKGTRLTSDQDNLNQLPVSDLALGSLLTQPYNSPAAMAAGIQAPYPGFTGTVAQALRRFPQYGAIADRFDPLGMSRYDALQVSVRKQVGDLQAMVNFTGAKALSNAAAGNFNGTFSPAPALDAADFGLEKAPMTDIPSRNLVLTWIYQLPVGSGKRFASGAHGVLNQLVGGWQLSAVQTYRNGLPLSVTGGIPNPIFNSTTRPNELAGVPVQLHSCSDVVLNSTVLANIKAFTNNSPFQLGTAPPVLPNYRGCAWLEEDLAVQKSFPITEKTHLEFRGEFYNILNRTKFADPNLNINSPGNFGQISSIDGQYQPRIIQFALKFIF